MSDTPGSKEQEKGDEVLRRLLGTPPEPKHGKGSKPIAPDGTKDSEGAPRDC